MKSILTLLFVLGSSLSYGKLLPTPDMIFTEVKGQFKISATFITTSKVVIHLESKNLNLEKYKCFVKIKTEDHRKNYITETSFYVRGDNPEITIIRKVKGGYPEFGAMPSLFCTRKGYSSLPPAL